MSHAFFVRNVYPTGFKKLYGRHAFSNAGATGAINVAVRLSKGMSKETMHGSIKFMLLASFGNGGVDEARRGI